MHTPAEFGGLNDMNFDHQTKNANGNATRTELALLASELSYRRLFEAAQDGNAAFIFCYRFAMELCFGSIPIAFVELVGVALLLPARRDPHGI